MRAVSKVQSRHHQAQRCRKCPVRIGEELCTACKRLVFLCIENMQDHADEQGMPGFFPMAAPFERAFRVHQDIGNILGVPHLAGTAAHFEERIVARASGICRIEADAI